VPWIEIFAVFAVSHLVGDLVLQTQWQATNKRGGLAFGSGESGRALAAHAVSYTLAFGPALIWLAGELSAFAVVGAALIVMVPHAIQDDGRLLGLFALRVKRMEPADYPVVMLLLDQSLHLVALFLTALLLAT
jgi:hypothetical protein